MKQKTNEHQEFIDIINKWGGPIRFWKDTDKINPSKFSVKDFVDITHEYEVVSGNQKFIEDIYREYV